MPSMVILVLHDLSRFQELLAAWREAGAPAITVLEGLGSREPKEQAGRELPLMPRLRDVLRSEDMPRTTAFSVVPDDRVDPLCDATQEVLGDLSESGKGILFVLPVAKVYGLRPPPSASPPEER